MSVVQQRQEVRERDDVLRHLHSRTRCDVGKLQSEFDVLLEREEARVQGDDLLLPKGGSQVSRLGRLNVGDSRLSFLRLEWDPRKVRWPRELSIKLHLLIIKSILVTNENNQYTGMPASPAFRQSLVK